MSHITGDFGDQFLQAISCTDTDNQAQKTNEPIANSRWEKYRRKIHKNTKANYTKDKRHPSRQSPTMYTCSCEFNTQNGRDSTRQLSRVGVGGVYWICGQFATDLVEKLKTERVKLAAKLETKSRLPTGEYTPPDTIQLDSTCSVFSFSAKSVASSRELVATPTRLNFLWTAWYSDMH